MAARRAARDQFDNKRNLTVDSKEADEAIEYGNAVAQVLRENVVQGKSKDGSEGLYSMRQVHCP
jgi:complex III assembly factor LYRM7